MLGVDFQFDHYPKLFFFSKSRFLMRKSILYSKKINRAFLSTKKKRNKKKFYCNPKSCTRGGRRYNRGRFFLVVPLTNTPMIDGESNFKLTPFISIGFLGHSFKLGEEA